MLKHLTFQDAVKDHQALGVAAADPLKLPIEKARELQDLYFESLRGELPSGQTITDHSIEFEQGKLNFRLIHPSTPGPHHYIVFIRGAGWWAGDLNSHMQTMTTLCELTSCVVCGVDYYKTPEHFYPTQINQVYSVIEHLHANHSALNLKGHPVLFGESAGATICLSVAQKFRDEQLKRIQSLVLFYCNADGFKPKAREYSQWVWLQYMGVKVGSIDHPSIPLRQSLLNLPAVWLAVGEDDALIGDTQKLHELMKACNSPSQLRIYPGLPHGFLMWTARLQPAFDALEDSAKVIASSFLG